MEEPEYKSTKEIRTIDRVTQNEVIYLKAVITLPELRDEIYSVRTSRRKKKTIHASMAIQIMDM